MASKSGAGSVDQWDRFIATRVVPVVERLLREQAPGGHDVPPLKVFRDPWGIMVFSRNGVIDTTWAGSLVTALLASKQCRAYVIQFTAREVVPTSSDQDAMNPSMGRMIRVNDMTDTSQLGPAVEHAVRRFGKENVRLEVALRHPR